MTSRLQNFTIQNGLPNEIVPNAALLYWEAFQQKLGPILQPEPRALQFLERCTRPDHAICAVGNDGRLVGVAGFKSASGAFIEGTFDHLRKVYGLPGASWRAPLLGFLERPLEEGVLLMDGICVAAEVRGTGVGSCLLDAIVEEATKRSMQSVRLDVVDNNLRAQALYERLGFIPIRRHNVGPLRSIFGFEAAIEYRRRV